MSFEIVLPYLEPIRHLILDESISEVMVNPSGKVFVECNGVMSLAAGITVDERLLWIAVRNIAFRLGDEVSDEQPVLNSRLPDGSRVAAVLAPYSVGGTTLTIRKFHSRWFSLEQLVELGMLTGDAEQYLAHAVLNRRNILIAGGSGSGKTTLLSALARLIPATERLIVIEDTAELKLKHENLVQWEARSQERTRETVSIRQFVRASLRHRPDRLIVGEVRGPEAFDLLQALNTGHAGSLSTIHANSASHSLIRLVNCVLEAETLLPHSAICANVAAAINVAVYLQREAGKRVVGEILEVTDYDQVSNKFTTTNFTVDLPAR